MFFGFFGVGTALYVLSKVSSSLFKKHVGREVSAIKRDVKIEKGVKEDIKKEIKRVVRKK